MEIKAKSAGRPSKLNEALLERAEAYLATCTEDIHLTDKDALSYIDIELPSTAGLALMCNVNKETLYQWELGRFYEGHEPTKQEEALLKRFSVVITRVRLEQERRLIGGTVGKKYEPRIAALILATHHGYSDKQDVTSGGQPIKVSIIDYGKTEEGK